jgi:hypothetical protein
VVTIDGIHLGDEGCAMIGQSYADATIRALRSLCPAAGSNNRFMLHRHTVFRILPKE